MPSGSAKKALWQTPVSKISPWNSTPPRLQGLAGGGAGAHEAGASVGLLSLASVAGLRAFPGESVYNASKFGQVGFTRPRNMRILTTSFRPMSEGSWG